MTISIVQSVPKISGKRIKASPHAISHLVGVGRPLWNSLLGQPLLFNANWPCQRSWKVLCRLRHSLILERRNSKEENNANSRLHTSVLNVCFTPSERDSLKENPCWYVVEKKRKRNMKGHNTGRGGYLGLFTKVCEHFSDFSSRISQIGLEYFLIYTERLHDN